MKPVVEDYSDAVRILTTLLLDLQGIDGQGQPAQLLQGLPAEDKLRLMIECSATVFLHKICQVVDYDEASACDLVLSMDFGTRIEEICDNPLHPPEETNVN